VMMIWGTDQVGAAQIFRIAKGPTGEQRMCYSMEAVRPERTAGMDAS
jgi:hypothetical protein